MIFVAAAYLAVVVAVGCYALTLRARQGLIRELVDASRPSAADGASMRRGAADPRKVAP